MNFDQEIFDYYKRAVALRRENEPLNHGEFSVLATEDVQRTMVFTRRSSKGTVLVALNRGDQNATIDLHVSAKKMKPIFVTHGELEVIQLQSSPEGSQLTLPPLTGVVFSYN